MRYLFILVVAVSMLFTKTSAQSNAHYTIDGESYFVTPTQLNDFYGQVFNKLIENKACKQKDFEVWTKSYDVYKSRAISGTHYWDVYHDRIANFKYLGSQQGSEADSGLIKGKVAKGNPNKKSNHAARMALLNGMMAVMITKEVTSKEVKL